MASGTQSPHKMHKMHKTVVIDVVGLSKEHLKPHLMPNVCRWLTQQRRSSAEVASESDAAKHNEQSVYACARDIRPVFPALTCVAQTTYLTGKPPGEHGIIANGFYHNEIAEVKNWSQSAAMVKAPRMFEAIKHLSPRATVFSNCWWNAVGDPNIDFLITPKPQYRANGLKYPDIYTHPPSLRETLQDTLGVFPLHHFWGPGANLISSKWIVEASKYVDRKYDPTLSLIYIPHLDYCLQRDGPGDLYKLRRELMDLDRILWSLINFYQLKSAATNIILLSEYGIQTVEYHININRALRSNRYLQVRIEQNREYLDIPRSAAFAVADHQIAHVYVKSKADIAPVKTFLRNIRGIEYVLDAREQDEYYGRKLHFPGRSGDLLAICAPNALFTYYFWLDDRVAPDYARTVAIHAKPGYDPAELLLWKPAWFTRNDPYRRTLIKIIFPGIHLVFGLIALLIGKIYLYLKLLLVYVFRLRLLIDATPLSPQDIRGSHGQVFPVDGSFSFAGCKHLPIFISPRTDILQKFEQEKQQGHDRKLENSSEAEKTSQTCDHMADQAQAAGIPVPVIRSYSRKLPTFHPHSASLSPSSNPHFDSYCPSSSSSSSSSSSTSSSSFPFDGVSGSPLDNEHPNLRLIDAEDVYGLILAHLQG